MSEESLTALLFWADWLTKASTHHVTKDPHTTKSSDRRRKFDALMSKGYSLNAIKTLILAARVNVERCIARGSRTYPCPTNFARNVQNAEMTMGELTAASSVMPGAGDLDVEGLKTLVDDEDGFAQITAHAKELIRRAKEADPYRPTNGHSNGRKWGHSGRRNGNRYEYSASGIGYNPSNPRDFDYTQTQAGGFIDRVCRGDQPLYCEQTEQELALYSAHISREELNRLYEERKEQRQRHQDKERKRAIAESFNPGPLMSREGKVIGCIVGGWTVAPDDQALYEDLKAKIHAAWAEAGIQI